MAMETARSLGKETRSSRPSETSLLAKWCKSKRKKRRTKQKQPRCKKNSTKRLLANRRKQSIRIWYLTLKSKRTILIKKRNLEARALKLQTQKNRKRSHKTRIPVLNRLTKVNRVSKSQSLNKRSSSASLAMLKSPPPKIRMRRAVSPNWSRLISTVTKRVDRVRMSQMEKSQGS